LFLSSVLAYHSSRLWSTYCLLANLLVLVFAIILVSLDANAVSPYNALSSTAPKKIQILKGQLAVAIFMLLLPFCFFAIYIYTAFASLRPLRAPNRSVYPPYPVLSPINKY
jgi:cytosine/uracil/thiamine/allantoin permease